MPRVLLINLAPTLVGTRTPSALRRAGFEVDLLSIGQSIFRASDHIAKRTQVNLGHAVSVKDVALGVAPVIAGSAADLLVCLESAAFRVVQFIAWGAHTLAQTAPGAVALARTSIGGRTFCDLNTLRAQLPVLLEAARLPVLPQCTCAMLSDQDAERFARACDCQLIIKSEGGENGASVIRIDGEDAWRQIRTTAPAGGVTLQRYVPGSVIRHSLIAWNGRVLAQFSAEQIHSRANHPFQAPTVVRLIQAPALREQATRLVISCALSGFVGLDFMVDPQTATPYLIDINPRVNSLTHLGALAGRDVCQALFDAMTGKPLHDEAPVTNTGAYASIFPYEWLRDRHSPYLQSAASDTPWDDLGVLRQTLNAVGGQISR